MTGARHCQDYLRDMDEAVTKAMQFMGTMSRDEFSADDKTVFAVVRALEILGEAANAEYQRIRCDEAEFLTEVGKHQREWLTAIGLPPPNPWVSPEPRFRVVPNRARGQGLPRPRRPLRTSGRLACARAAS